MPSQVARTRSAGVDSRQTPVSSARSRGSTKGARSPDGAKYGSTRTPCAPGGVPASSVSTSSWVTPVVDSTQSRAAVPTIAGMARSQCPGRSVQMYRPAGSPARSTSAVPTSAARQVPTISSPSPSAVTPAPSAQAGRS